MERMRLPVMLLTLVLIVASCRLDTETPSPTDLGNMPNPASLYCEEQGGRLEIRTDEDGGQYGMCIFADDSECEEWAFFRGDCEPAAQITSTGEPIENDQNQESSTNEIPTLPTINPEDYATWRTYTHPVYGFSFKLPEDWIVREDNSGGVLSGHLLTLLPETEGEGMNIRLTFREQGDDTLLWPTGVGEGEFTGQGSLQMGNTTVNRNQLVCPSGEITSLWYQGSGGSPAIQLGELEFGIIYLASASHCTPGISLEGKNQLVGEMIIASLNIP